MKAEEFNKISDWIEKNNYELLMQFLPPEFHEDCYKMLEDYAEKEKKELLLKMKEYCPEDVILDNLVNHFLVLINEKIYKKYKDES